MIDVHKPWKDIKRRNTEYYFRFVYGWRLYVCGACSGSGYYDAAGSPPCGACEGSKRVRLPGPKSNQAARMNEKGRWIICRN